jgi:hypothetical protein
MCLNKWVTFARQAQVGKPGINSLPDAPRFPGDHAMFVKPLLIAFMTLAATGSCFGQTWFYANGGQDPSTVPTSEGNLDWPYNGGGPGVYFETVPGNGGSGDTALHIVDNSATDKPRWDATEGIGIKSSVSDGFTACFGLKGEAASNGITILQFCNTLNGASTYNKIQFKLVPVAAEIHLQWAKDSFDFGRVDDRFHDVWVKSYVNPDTSVHFEFWFDAVWVHENSFTQTTSSTKVGIDSGTETGAWVMDYLAYCLDGAYDPGTPDLETPVIHVNPCDPVIWADADHDGDVDQVDFGVFQQCYTGDTPLIPTIPEYACSCFDRVDGDGPGVIDQADLTEFEKCATGPGISWTGCTS